MARFQFSPNCCCVQCTILNDEFTRADSANLGSNWEELSGTWDIDTNALAASSTSSAVLAVPPHPDGSYSGVVEVQIKAGTNANRARVILDAVDANNYHFAEIIVNGASSRVDLYKRSGGVNTLLRQGDNFTLSASVYVSVKVCLNDTLIIAYVDASHRNYYPYVVPHGGDRVGLGTGATVSGDILFDSFTYSKHESTELLTCPSCTICTSCGGDRVPTQMMATISGITGNRCNNTLCGNLNGTYVLYYSPLFCEQISTPGDPTTCYWQSEEITGACEIGLSVFDDCTSTQAMSTVKPHWTLRKRSNGNLYLWINENLLQNWGFGSFGYYPNFQKEPAADCDTLSSYSMDRGANGGSPSCTFSAATATVSAI